MTNVKNLETCHENKLRAMLKHWRISVASCSEYLVIFSLCFKVIFLVEQSLDVQGKIILSVDIIRVMLSCIWVSSIIPIHWGNSCAPNNFLVSYFTLFSVVRRSMGLSSEIVVIVYRTILIIAGTDTLEIPKLFVVFLWLFWH